MPVMTIKNNSPRAIGFINVDGGHYFVPSRGQVEVDLDQRDVDAMHHVCDRAARIADKESEATGKEVLPELEVVKGAAASAEAKKNAPRDEPVVRTTQGEAAGDEGGEVKRRK